MAEAKRRYTGPSGVTNDAIGALNPDKGAVLQHGHTYVVTGHVQELPEDDWQQVSDSSSKSDSDKE